MTESRFRAGITRLAAATLLAFAVLIGATLYWGIVRADELAGRADNPRRYAEDRRIRRGAILDRSDRILAHTVFHSDGPAREYPVPAAAPVVGFQTWRYGAGAVEGASYGAGGAEAAYDNALRGDVGRPVREVIAGRILARPHIGNDIVLTLDADLQTEAYDALGAREGAIVVIDVEDGAVRALVSRPTFDPAALDLDPSRAADPDVLPLFNRATHGLYPPGSTWKMVTLAAALAEGEARPGDEFDDGDAVEYFQGFPVRCDNNPEGVNRFDLEHAFAYSCNVTFARLGVALGEQRFTEWGQRFGLGGAPPFPLGAASASLSTDRELEAPELASAAFGQGEVLVTPLHMALVAAAAGGDGTLPTPYLLADVPGVRWRQMADERGEWRRAMASSTAEEVRRIMVTSVQDGWARSALLGRSEGLGMGGKTGTAEAPGGAPHAWFIGFAPAERPRVAIAVLVVRGGSGGDVAAPIAGRVLERAVELDRLADSSG